MIQSSKPRKQRLFRYTADMHARQHFVHAHVDKALRQKLGIKTRAVQVSKGDTVKIMSGKNRGKTGKVTRVNMRRGFVYLDSLKKKNARGKEFDVPTHASNLYITDMSLSDKYRAGKLKVKVAEKPVAKSAKEPEKKQESKPAQRLERTQEEKPAGKPVEAEAQAVTE